MFLQKYKQNFFCGYKILKDGVFLAKVSNNAESQFGELYGLRQIAVS
jgi:hypothetical protein